MKRMIVLGLALPLLLAACGGSGQNPSVSADAQRQSDLYAIDQIERVWHKASSTHDVDLIAEFEPGRRFTLIDMVKLENRLQDLLGVKVDLFDRFVARRERFSEIAGELLTKSIDLRERCITPRNRLGDPRLDRRLLPDRQLDAPDDAEHVLLLRPHAVRRLDAEIGFRGQPCKPNVFFAARCIWK